MRIPPLELEAGGVVILLVRKILDIVVEATTVYSPLGPLSPLTLFS